MPIFKVGDFNTIGLNFVSDASGLVRHTELKKTEESWGLFLKRIALLKKSNGILDGLFKFDKEIYFTSVAWDYSGNAPFVYPSKDIEPSNFWIKMKEGDLHEFIGDGIVLWPPRIVSGALSVVILVYENDQEIRDIGEVLGDIHDSVQSSKLVSLIAAISANPTLAVGAAIGSVVNELAGVIGKVMERNKNDYIDLFEGSYQVGKPRQTESKEYKQKSASIELEIAVI